MGRQGLYTRTEAESRYMGHQGLMHRKETYKQRLYMDKFMRLVNVVLLMNSICRRAALKHWRNTTVNLTYRTLLDICVMGN